MTCIDPCISTARVSSYAAYSPSSTASAQSTIMSAKIVKTLARQQERSVATMFHINCVPDG